MPSSKVSTIIALTQHVVGSGRTEGSLVHVSQNFLTETWASCLDRRGLHNRTGSQGKGPDGEKTGISLSLSRPAPALELTPGQVS